MDLEELFRLLSNLVRRGTVMAVDLSAKPPKVRVKSGDLESDWMPWFESRAGTTQIWDPPTEGEQGVMLCPEGDPTQGVFLRGIPSEDIPAPSSSGDEWMRKFPDGAVITYNHATGALKASGMKTIDAEASDQIMLKAPLVLIDGKAVVKDLLTYEAGLSGTDGKGNKTSIKGDFRHEDGELSSNGVVLDKHDHDGVIRGGDTTDGPNRS